MPSSRIVFPIVLCASFALPALAQKAEKVAEPITLANVNNVGLLSEVKHSAWFLELGPGPNEVLLFPRGGNLLVVDDKNLKLKREIDTFREYVCSRDQSLSSWLEGTTTILRNEKTGKTMELDAGKLPTGAAFSPDNKLFAVGEVVTMAGAEGRGFSVMRVFDTSTGELVHKLDGAYGAVRPVFSPNGKLLAVSNRNHEARIYDVATGKQLHELPKRMTQEIAFSPDGKTLAAAYVDGHLGLWDVESGKELHMVESGCSAIHSVAWNSTGDLVATCSPAGGKRGPNNTFTRMAGKVLLWNAKTAKIAKELMDVSFSGRVRFTPDNKRIVATVRKLRTLDPNPMVAIWSTSAPPIATTPMPKIDVPTIPVEHMFSLPMGISSVAVSPDGKKVFAQLNGKYEMATWSLSTGEQQLVFKGKHGTTIMRSDFSPDGSTVATASRDHTAKLWNATTGELLATMKGHTDHLRYITFSPSGKYILTSTDGKQYPYEKPVPLSARVWDGKTGKSFSELKSHMDTIQGAKFSADDRLVLTRSDDHTARLWDAASGNELHTFEHNSRIETIEFSPNGATILTSSSGRRSSHYKGADRREPPKHSMKMWSVMTGKLLLELPHLQGVTASFNESGDQIITSCWGLITFWDTTTGKELATQREPLVGTEVVFCPNRNYFVVAEPDQPLELWSIADQKQIARMEIEKPYRSFFSRDGKKFYSLTRAGEFRSWSMAGLGENK